MSAEPVASPALLEWSKSGYDVPDLAQIPTPLPRPANHECRGTSPACEAMTHDHLTRKRPRDGESNRGDELHARALGLDGGAMGLAKSGQLHLKAVTVYSFSFRRAVGRHEDERW